MKITAIEKQKKIRDRYNIYLDNEFAFGLYEDTILKFGLRSNDELPEEKLNEIRDYDELCFGKYIAYSFLSFKPRSEREVYRKLKANKISENSIKKIISQFTELKYIDDRAYAKLYIESRLNSKPAGRRLIKLKLAGKGIETETADNVMNEIYNEAEEFSSAIKLTEKYAKKLKSMNDFERRKKCFSYLISRGFDFDTANNVLNELKLSS